MHRHGSVIVQCTDSVVFPSTVNSLKCFGRSLRGTKGLISSNIIYVRHFQLHGAGAWFTAGIPLVCGRCGRLQFSQM